MTSDSSNKKEKNIHTNFLKDEGINLPEEGVIKSVIAQVEEILKGSMNMSTGGDTGDFYHQLGKKFLRDIIIDTYKKQKPFTSGQEGEVFKLDIGIGKKVLLLKRKFKKGSTGEFNLHKIAYELSLKSKSDVKVPTLYDCFIDGEHELILMEFMEGKTLYNIQWQAIVKDILLIEVEKAIQRNNNLKLKGKLDEYKNKYLKNGFVDFENDTVCEEGVLELLFIMYEEGILKDNPGMIEHKNGKKHYTQLEKIYKENLFKVGVFDSQKQKDYVVKSLKEYLTDMNKQGFFHRDLGGNPRNIILNKQGERIDISVIDFGKSEKLQPGIKSSFYDEFNNAEYDQDIDMISIMQSMKIIDQKSDDKLFDKIGLEDIRLKADSLGIEMSDSYIVGNYNFLKSRNKTLINLLNNLIEGKNQNHGNYIYLKPKLDAYELSSTQKGKKELFLMLYSLKKQDREELKNILQESLKNNKKSIKYRYAKLFSDYLEVIEK